MKGGGLLMSKGQCFPHQRLVIGRYCLHIQGTALLSHLNQLTFVHCRTKYVFNTKVV